MAEVIGKDWEVPKKKYVGVPSQARDLALIRPTNSVMASVRTWELASRALTLFRHPSQRLGINYVYRI